jgi:uncharacterized protein
MRVLTLTLSREQYAACRLAPRDAVPQWADTSGFSSITRTADELSILCRADAVPPGVPHQGGWRLFRIEGPFDFTAVGILLAAIQPLRDAGIPMLAVSTFDTDYLLVQELVVERAVGALAAAGHTVRGL